MNCVNVVNYSLTQSAAGIERQRAAGRKIPRLRFADTADVTRRLDEADAADRRRLERSRRVSLDLGDCDD